MGHEKEVFLHCFAFLSLQLVQVLFIAADKPFSPLPGLFSLSISFTQSDFFPPTADAIIRAIFLSEPVSLSPHVSSLFYLLWLERARFQMSSSSALTYTYMLDFQIHFIEFLSKKILIKVMPQLCYEVMVCTL